VIKNEIEDRGRQFHDSLQNHYKDYIKFFEYWLGDKENFIRELCFGYEETAFRKLTTSSQHLLKQLLYYCDPDANIRSNRSPVPNVWISVFEFESLDPDSKRPRPLYSSAIINTIPFDFDFEECLQVAWDEAEPLRGVGGRVLFTGKKGFQAHLPSEVRLTPEQLKAAQEARHLVLDWQSSDPAIYGDAARVLRLPFSLHRETGLCAVLVQDDDTLESVLDRAQQVVVPCPR